MCTCRHAEYQPNGALPISSSAVPISTGEKVCNSECRPPICLLASQCTACIQPRCTYDAQHAADQKCPDIPPHAAGHSLGKPINLDHKPLNPKCTCVLPCVQVFTPSGQMLDYGMPRALDASEIPRIVKQFADGARNSLAAGVCAPG